MKKSFGKLLLTGLAAATFAVSAAALNPPPAQAISLGTIVSAAVEQQKITKSLNYYENEGRGELFEEIKKSEGVNNDPQMNAILKNIMTRLSDFVGQSEPSIKERPYNYFVNNDEAFNAFCTLGHNISVNTGVFYFFNNDEDRIAAIVAHELVHGQRNHPIGGAKKKLTVDFLQKTVGVNLGGAGRLAADVVAVNVKNAGITKPNEWEADKIAFNYLAGAGYNIGAPAAVWQRVIDNTQSRAGSDFFSNLLNPSTHPADKDRRANYGKMMTEYSNNKVAVDENTGEIKINGQVFMKPVAISGMSGLERAYLAAGRLAMAYHAGALEPAGVVNGTFMLGDKAIVTPADGDQNAQNLAQTFNSIK